MKSARVSAAHQLPRAELAEPVPVWDGDDYARVQPGEYTATIVRVGAPEWMRRWKRWSVTVSYELDSGEQVPGYYSLGEDRDRPKVARRGRYWRLYQAAVGTPKPGAMPPGVLQSRKVCITVTDSLDGGYSRVTAESALESKSASVSPSTSESLSPSESFSMSESDSVSMSMSVSGNQVQAQAQVQASRTLPEKGLPITASTKGEM